MSFYHTIKEQNKINLIELRGNLLERNQATDLLNEVNNLLEQDSKKFIICLKDFHYINSTGLNVMVTILTRARKAGGEVVICCVSEKVKELLVITKLNAVFIVTETKEEAVKYLDTETMKH